MISPFLMLIAALAGARITRLITTDRIFEAPRLWLINKLDPLSLSAYVITCSWCTGLWVACVTLSAAWHWRDSPWLQVPLCAMALAEIIGLIASRDGD
jgi:hypothetical protein